MLTSGAAVARKDDFVTAIQRALMFEVAVFLATIGLLLLLPKASRAPEAGQDEAAAILGVAADAVPSAV